MADIPFKILVVGELGAGKTSLVQRYAKNLFTENYKATVNTFHSISEKINTNILINEQ